MIPLWVLQKLERVMATGLDGSVTVHLQQGRVSKIETTGWEREPKEKETQVLVA